MSRPSLRATLVLQENQKLTLTNLSFSRTAPAREVERAKILLAYIDGKLPTEISRLLGVSRPTIYRCIDKALSAGVNTALKDRYHRPHAPVIDDSAIAWVVDLACQKPKDLGFAAELWTIAALLLYVQKNACAAGHERLALAGKATIWRILNNNEIKPHKVRYYLQRRDPKFEQKMADILMVYRDVNLYQAGAVFDARPVPIYTVSVDEKPGVQALGTTAADLPPVPSKHAYIGRDPEYVRHGTVSILAALDLHTGEITASIEDRHRSIEFIGLLEKLHKKFPSEAIIRVVLDNHSAHISRETMAWLALHPGRFEYVHTPKHGSWLNLVECAFSKMARSFLRHIRVSSTDELKVRITQGIEEMNQHPVKFQWKKTELEISNYS